MPPQAVSPALPPVPRVDTKVHPGCSRPPLARRSPAVLGSGPRPHWRGAPGGGSGAGPPSRTTPPPPAWLSQSEPSSWLCGAESQVSPLSWALRRGVPAPSPRDFGLLRAATPLNSPGAGSSSSPAGGSGLGLPRPLGCDRRQRPVWGERVTLPRGRVGVAAAGETRSRRRGALPACVRRTGMPPHAPLAPALRCSPCAGAWMG